MPCAYEITTSTNVKGTKTSGGTAQLFTDFILSGGGINAFGVIHSNGDLGIYHVRYNVVPDPYFTTNVFPAPVTPGSSGLNTGAKTGIGAGVALGAIAVILGIIAMVMYGRKRSKRNP
ncbi:hypothetical protein BDV96DRAFT_607797 [Lophiotrema nucula]|uniref:Uncharacterized protein n=1 Tax=Lophiotrema nucula TaxID=690887 RepID=A0A6A5YFX5_9PLEO|nr:hypothetical protein BDV96DRAFT_607797 [Lophiotrema nucula]